MKNIVMMLYCLFLLGGAEAVELSSATRALNGAAITYDYTSGRSYNVKFEEAGVSYRYLSGPKPGVWWGPFPYQAFEVEKNIYFASWFEAGYGDYVTLLINFNSGLLYGSAILSGKEVHFHGAKIREVKR
jgi:phenolic acid decarboxylase